jgi:hypothetical protein
MTIQHKTLKTDYGFRLFTRIFTNRPWYSHGEFNNANEVYYSIYESVFHFGGPYHQHAAKFQSWEVARCAKTIAYKLFPIQESDTGELD